MKWWMGLEWSTSYWWGWYWLVLGRGLRRSSGKLERLGERAKEIINFITFISRPIPTLEKKNESKQTGYPRKAAEIEAICATSLIGLKARLLG